MTPRQLLEQLAALGVTPTGVADDSRQLQAGDVFLAYPGALADGRRYIADAVARGACAVLWQAGGDFVWDPAWTVPNLMVENLRALAGPLAHAVYQHPSEALSLIAITGTNGKTTISQCLARVYPKPCAVIGTLGAGFPGALVDTGFTTPEASVLMRYLAQFRDLQAAACALEASSIGIEEGRLNGARVDVAVFTNLTRDHLDYHGDMAAYAAAKEKLFGWPRLRTAVINLDDAFGLQLLRRTSAMRVIGYSLAAPRRDHPALVRAENLSATPYGQRFDLLLPTGRVSVDTTLAGEYNVSNLLACAAVLLDAGLDAREIGQRLSALTPPAGRMEHVGGVGEPLVVVDYAHTPDALENALRALRPLSRARGGKLSVVFGCGGNRDPGKRPQMGAIAAAGADALRVTSDNPRGEVAEEIIAAIVRGVPESARSQLICETDRAQAIARAVAEAAPEDVILLAGKGHETYQEIAGERLPFSDRAQAEQALAERGMRRAALQEKGS
ncbi:UDP-N-acetylmuramoyl-L-alanyl-D-glutamate--2,6-diaminopimelate ligase [Azonexus sp.]|uniref:UDP-N-acetylmuramoyl-L-alanyl-D-glutamate--2, 6-diaminopimelate ligase n=1 Tax=Azonexus sp. TaxID=1872668 RepID=UPI0039E5CC98